MNTMENPPGSPCAYCSAPWTTAIEIEPVQLGKAVRDKDGVSLGRPILKPAIHARVCDDHAAQVRRAVAETEEQRASRRKEAAKRAAETRKWRKAQERLA